MIKTDLYHISFSYVNTPAGTGEQVNTYAHVRRLSDDALLASGVAHCHPGDRFVKATGRKIALTRALRLAKLSKEERTAVWNAYLTR